MPAEQQKPPIFDGDALAPDGDVLAATGLGLRTREGWVFRGVTLTAAAGRVTALTAPDGSGKSSLLLALTGRMAVTEGTLDLRGESVLADARAARQRTAVARIADVAEPEGQLTVTESVAERCLIEGVRCRDGRAAFDDACRALDTRFDTASLVEHLPASHRTLLAVALAAVRPADVIVLDDTDRGVTADDERDMYRALAALAGTGPAIVTTTTRAHIPTEAGLGENGVIPVIPVIPDITADTDSLADTDSPADTDFPAGTDSPADTDFPADPAYPASDAAKEES